MDAKQLSKLGLTESESTIYYSVLKLGTCTVKQISKECGFHRTNIYDILEQLKEKGLVTYFKEANSVKYSVSDPQNLYGLLREKKELLDKIFPEIEGLRKISSEEIQVEVYKGNEGMKSAFRDMIKESKPIYAFGVKGQLREKLPVFAEQWLRDMKNKKIKYYGVYTKRHPPEYYTEIKYVSEELSGPVATFVYGDKININIWEPTLVSIVIKSKLVAQMYKKHFDLLWKIARK
jgi:sugar-specific transcriptional regulator TrmB